MIKDYDRILGCYDNILSSKYFILSKYCKYCKFKEIIYFYNIVENFFIENILKNPELLSEGHPFDELAGLNPINFNYYLNKENYEIFKIINYENIIEMFNIIENAFNFSYEDINYKLADFYIVLDYIQERSFYLDLKQIKKDRRI